MTKHPLLLSSSKIFVDSNLIDNIHQSIIDLQFDPPKDEIRKLFDDSISYLDADIDSQAMDELLSLILSCYLRIPEQKNELFKIIFENSQKNSNRLILFALILSQTEHSSVPSEVRNLISIISKQILSQIRQPQEQFKIFNHEISPKYKSNFICDIILTLKASEKVVSLFYSYILTQKDISKTRIDKIFQKISKSNAITLLSEDVLIKTTHFENFSQENLSVIIPKLTEKTFLKVLHLIHETFSEEKTFITPLVSSLFDKCIEFDIKFKILQDFFPTILDSLDHSIIKPSYWNYFDKNDIILPQKVTEKIVDFPDPKTALKVIQNIQKVPIEILAEGLLQTDDIEIFERLVQYSFYGKENSTFSEEKFWLHLFSVISSSKEKYSNSLMNKIVDIFEKFVDENNFFIYVESMIFENYPTTNNGNYFLFDLYSRLSYEYKENFNENKEVLLTKIRERKKFPLPSFWNLFDFEFIEQFFEEENNIPLMLYAYHFCNISSLSTRKIKTITIRTLKSEKSKNLIADFISNNDLDYLANMDEDSLSLIISALIFVEQKEKPKIFGLTKETVLPFISILFNFLNSINSLPIEISSEIENLILPACKYLSKSDMPLLIESIDSILNHYDHLFNPDFFKCNVTFEMIEILFFQLINNCYKADKSILLEMIFSLQSQYSTNEKVKLLFDKNGINLFVFIIKNKSKIKNFERLKKFEFDLKILGLNKISKIAVDSIQNVLFYEESINTINFLENYCKNVPKLKFTNLKNINKIIHKTIERKKWNDIFNIFKFMAEKSLEKEFKENSMINFSFDSLHLDKFLLDILTIEKIENTHSIFEMLFKILMKDDLIATNYLIVLFEKISFTWNIEPKVFLEKYSNEYKTYKDLFINSMRKVFGFHPISQEFVRKTKVKNISTNQSKILTKIFDLTNKKINDYQSFILLQNIASSFPFLFSHLNIKKLFSTVVKTLDSFTLLFTVQNNSDKEIINDLKRSLSAYSFLISLLYSVEILDAFIPWLYSKITSFSPSQIISMTFILNSLFKTKRVKDAMLALSSKLNFPGIMNSLLEHEVPNEIQFHYKTQIFNLLTIYYKLLNNLYHKKKLILIDEIMKIKKPFNHVFNNFLTIHPIKLDQSFLPEIKNDELKKFWENINEVKTFWINYDRPSIEPKANEIDKFIDHYIKIEKNIPEISCNQSEMHLDTFYSKIQSIRYCAREPFWIYQWMVKGNKFIELQEHDDILCQVLRDVESLNTNEEDEFYFDDEIDVDCYFLADFCQNELFNKLIKEFSLNNDKHELFNAVVNNRVAIYSFLDLLNLYISENRDENESIKRLLNYLFNSEIKNKDTFKVNFSDVCGNNLIDFALSPGIRDDSDMLYKISEILCQFENLPMKVTFIAGLLFNANKEKYTQIALKLCFQTGSNEFPNIIKTIQNLFDKQFENDKKVPSYVAIKYYLKLCPSLIQTKESVILMILKQALLYYSNGHKDDQEAIDLVCLILNKLAPERELTQQLIIPTDEEIDFSISYSSTRANNNASESHAMLQQAPKDLIDSNPTFWNLYCDYRTVLNDIVINDEKCIEKLKFLSDFPELLCFEKRLAHFQNKMKKRITKDEYLDVNVNRSTVLVDSYEQLYRKTREEWLCKLRISFKGEKGVDMGGLTKEWFSLVTKEIFNPNFALFNLSENQTYQPNPLSGINADHIGYFRFIGKVIARALIQRQCVNAHFTRSFCRQILHQQVKLKDFEDINENIYKSMKSILDDDVEPLCLNFTIDEDELGVTKTILLKENGDEIDVNNENKKEYVSLYTNYRLRKSIIDQVTAFCEGFNFLIPHEEIKMFSPSELDLLICGIPNIDVNDLMMHTSYSYPYNKDHPVVQMFFKVISNWSNEYLGKFLLFLTGSSQMPVIGFKYYCDIGKPITLSHVSDKERLCVAHTCFNTLDLPEYDSEEIMNRKLLQSIEELEFAIA